MQQNQNFPIVSGDSKDVYVDILDAEGLPLPLNDVTIKWVLYSRDATVLEKSTLDGGIFVEEDGKCVILLSPSDTAELAGLYNHYLRVEDPLGNPTTVLIGGVEAIKVP